MCPLSIAFNDKMWLKIHHMPMKVSAECMWCSACWHFFSAKTNQRLGC